MKKVLVTGANGHVGQGLVRLLVEKGYAVRASVRDANDAEKTRNLRALNVELVSADIMQAETLGPAVEGVDGVFQVAAVYKTHAKDPQKEIIEPSITGGLNVLRAAHAAGVKKVVFTSSVAAVGSDATAEKPLTEDDWNDDARNPYFYAKTEAERRAWQFAQEHGLNLVTINPCAVIGPWFWRHTPSTQAFELVLRGKMPAVIPVGFCFVDVRDVAAAHLLAYESPEAKGRYICSDAYFSMRDLMPVVKELEPAAKVPSLVVPGLLLTPLAMMDWLGNKLLGMPRMVTRSMIEEMGNKEQRVSSAKLRRELGWQPRPFKESLRDTLDWIKQTFINTRSRA